MNLFALNLKGGDTNFFNTTTPSFGSATKSGSTITYTPTTGYAGRDSFFYTICASEPANNCAQAQVSVVVRILAVDDFFTGRPTVAVQLLCFYKLKCAFIFCVQFCKPLPTWNLMSCVMTQHWHQSQLPSPEQMEMLEVSVLTSKSGFRGKKINHQCLGTITVNLAARRIVYTPVRAYAGTETFTYTVCTTDPSDNCATANVFVRALLFIKKQKGK